ncbi:MAG: hypothetical protein NTW74_12950 [Acidobacteria bacterium]|nr:hypothetical protein [Acidobacteriota bacterium]
MNIEITMPELEALIQQHLRNGTFKSPEDVILHALRSTKLQPSVQAPNTPSEQASFGNLSDLLLSSPLSGANLDLTRTQDYPRSLDLE